MATVCHPFPINATAFPINANRVVRLVSLINASGFPYGCEGPEHSAFKCLGSLSPSG